MLVRRIHLTHVALVQSAIFARTNGHLDRKINTLRRLCGTISRDLTRPWRTYDRTKRREVEEISTNRSRLFRGCALEFPRLEQEPDSCERRRSSAGLRIESLWCFEGALYPDSSLRHLRSHHLVVRCQMTAKATHTNAESIRTYIRLAANWSRLFVYVCPLQMYVEREWIEILEQSSNHF